MSIMSLIRPMAARSFAVQRGFASTAVTLRSKKAETGHPEPPRRPPTAYSLYQTEWYAKKKEELGDAKMRITEYAREAADAWKALSDDVKATYQTKTKEATDTYDRAYREWYEALDAQAKKEIQAVRGRPLSFPGGKVAYKKEQAEKARAAGTPPKPVTPFFEFASEFRASPEGQGKKPQDVAKEAGARWKEMSEEQKKPYVDTAADKKAKYQAWEAETA